MVHFVFRLKIGGRWYADFCTMLMFSNTRDAYGAALEMAGKAQKIYGRQGVLYLQGLDQFEEYHQAFNLAEVDYTAYAPKPMK